MVDKPVLLFYFIGTLNIKLLTSADINSLSGAFYNDVISVGIGQDLCFWAEVIFGYILNIPDNYLWAIHLKITGTDFTYKPNLAHSLVGKVKLSWINKIIYAFLWDFWGGKYHLSRMNLTVTA